MFKRARRLPNHMDNWGVALHHLHHEGVGMRLRFLSVLFLALASGCATVDRPPPQFQVGDIAVARHFAHHPELNGTHVRVTGGYQWRWIKDGSTLRCYAVTTVDGQELAAQGFQLQRLVLK